MRPHAAQSIQTLTWASDLVIGRIIELSLHERNARFCAVWVEIPHL